MHQLYCSTSPTLLDSVFSSQLQPCIGLLLCALVALLPSSSLSCWMTANKSPGLLLASPSLCNSTAGECAFSYEAHCHQALKTQAQTAAKLPWSSGDISSDILLTETIVTIVLLCHLLHHIRTSPHAMTRNTENEDASAAATLITRVCIKISFKDKTTKTKR